jgi:peptide/nickel transport system permease protein
MSEIPQNSRRSRFHQSLAAASRAISRGWDLYLFIIGYGAIFGFLGLAAWWLPDSDFPAAGPGAPMAPGMEHWFGSNRNGDDMMAPILKGSGMAIWLALTATVVGTGAGLLAGTVFYFLWRERGDRMLAAVSEWISALPAMVLALGLAAGWGTGFWPLVIILGGLCAVSVAGRATFWYREVEGRGDVLAARAIVDEFLTRIWQRTGATAAMLLPGVLLAVAALDFIFAGSGRLGHLLAEGQDHLIEAPWLFFFPGLALSILTILLAALAWAVRRTVQEPLQERLW